MPQDDKKHVTAKLAADLKTRYEGTHVGLDYDEDFEMLGISLPAGRDKRTTWVSTKEKLDTLTKLPLESIHFVGDYAAFYSTTDHVIEALIEPISPSGPYQDIATIFGVAPYSSEPKKPIVIASNGVKITLQTTSQEFATLASLALGYDRNLMRREGVTSSIKISGAKFATNEEAISILRKAADAVFFQIDAITGAALGLARMRDRRTGSARETKPLLSDALEYPKYEFQQEPMSYYWFARGAKAAPHFQFLSFYQVLEYYYATYAHSEACKRIKLLLKNPTFRTDRDADIAKLVEATEIRDQSSERDKLKATLGSCIQIDEFRSWIQSDEARCRALTTKEGTSISKHILSLKDTSTTILEQASLRVYDIRCRIVHTGADAPTQTTNILPYSKEAKQLRYDIDMIAYLARQTLIANAAPLLLPQ
jgi:hypothetical protein